MKVENLEIGKKIKLLREKFGVRQRELENELNIPNGTITQVENNKINIRLNYLKSIAEYFNVDYRWIMGIEREEEILNKNDKKIIEDETLEAKISKTVAAYLKDNIKENKKSYPNRPFIEIAEEYFRNPNINKNDKRDTLDKINKIFYSL